MEFTYGTQLLARPRFDSHRSYECGASKPWNFLKASGYNSSASDHINDEIEAISWILESQGTWAYRCPWSEPLVGGKVKQYTGKPLTDLPSEILFDIIRMSYPWRRINVREAIKAKELDDVELAVPFWFLIKSDFDMMRMSLTCQKFRAATDDLLGYHQRMMSTRQDGFHLKSWKDVVRMHLIRENKLVSPMARRRHYNGSPMKDRGDTA